MKSIKQYTIKVTTSYEFKYEDGTVDHISFDYVEGGTSLERKDNFRFVGSSGNRMAKSEQGIVYKQHTTTGLHDVSLRPPDIS